MGPKPPCPVCKRERSEGMARELNQPFDWYCPDCLHVFTHQTAWQAMVPRLHRAIYTATHFMNEEGKVEKRDPEEVRTLLGIYDDGVVNQALDLIDKDKRW